MADLQNNPVFIQDMEYLCSLPLMEELRGRTVLVTGATGLIGSTLASAFLRAQDGRIRVIACVRDREKAERLFGSLDRGNLDYLVADILSMPNEKLFVPVDYVVHAASQTSSRAFVERPADTIFTAVEGTRRALEFASANEVRRFVYLSTMEVYGTPADDGKIDESHGTDLDTMQPRSCYPESKRLCENLCASWQKQYGLPVRVLRLTQTFGPGVRYDDGRVFAEFARCALEGRDIVLKTAGETKRSYLYTADAASAILTVLLRGEDGRAYNAANEDTYCSIREMAELVVRECAGRDLSAAPECTGIDRAVGRECDGTDQPAVCEPADGSGQDARECADGGRKKIRVRIEAAQDPGKLGYAPTLHMNLDASRLRALGWRPTRSLAESYRRMMIAMK